MEGTTGAARTTTLGIGTGVFGAIRGAGGIIGACFGAAMGRVVGTSGSGAATGAGSGRVASLGTIGGIKGAGVGVAIGGIAGGAGVGLASEAGVGLLIGAGFGVAPLLASGFFPNGQIDDKTLFFSSRASAFAGASEGEIETGLGGGSAILGKGGAGASNGAGEKGVGAAGSIAAGAGWETGTVASSFLLSSREVSLPRKPESLALSWPNIFHPRCQDVGLGV